MTEPMTEADLMTEVWADPHCPVTLAGPNAEYPHAPPVPYPKTRVAVPATASEWNYQCPRHGRLSPGFMPEEDEPARKIVDSIVRMRPRVWLVNVTGQERSVLVHLGQCKDCGRIYWGTNWDQS